MDFNTKVKLEIIKIEIYSRIIKTYPELINIIHQESPVICHGEYNLCNPYFMLSLFWIYNFYFNFSPFSPLPYAVACAALPASIFYAVDRTPPLWVLAVGAMLGVAFHFANVIKDLSQDRESDIGGLPQR